MSRFVIALFFFFSIGFLTIKVIDPIKAETNLTDNQDKTWTEWALDDFNRNKNNPAKIVIIGSSLVLTPLNLADAHFHNCTINGAFHHTSDLLSSFLKEQNNSETNNFSFALPGLMPSDAYLITKLLLTGKDRPKLLVYGVGPRDFVDNLLASPTSTDPYHCLFKYLPIKDKDEAISLYRKKEWQTYLDYFLVQYFPLYGLRDEILAFCFKESQNLLAKSPIGLTNLSVSTNTFTVADVHNLLPSYNPMAIAANQCLFQPQVELSPDRFVKNLDEYRLRYHKINWDTFACQSNFFLDILKTARENNINVLIVAMPITSVNRELLPDYIFTLYKNNLRVLSKSFGAHFLDLDNMSCFNDDDFGDTVHLSTTGSTKMVKLVSDYIIGHGLNKFSIGDHNHLAETGLKL